MSAQDQHINSDNNGGLYQPVAALPNPAEPGDFFALLKPRVMSLVIFTALVGVVLAPGNLHPFLSFVAILCISVGAGASGALNMWYDADIDAEMDRTKDRPIPAGRITPEQARTFGLVLSIASVGTLGVLINWMAAGLLAFTILFYAVIYTMWLKRRTPQNIVIGGAAGALPPVVGWAAVTGDVSLVPLVLFLIIFMWTPPHFWALALIRTGDYDKADVPMMPNVAGPDSTRKQILIYSLILVPIALLPVPLGAAGPIYGALAGLSGAGFLWFAFQVFRRREGDPAARAAGQLFAYSIFYLFLLFAVLLVEQGLLPMFGIIL